MAGNLYALEADDGRKLWNQKLGGALGGGIISYAVEGQQRLAVTRGVKSAILVFRTPVGRQLRTGSEKATR
jgi:outer membrane protein assembly factor BamB